MTDQSTTERIAELERKNAALLLALQEFRHAAVFALYHHQGGHSPVGQPIRKLLGIGQFDDIPADALEAAKAWAIGDIRPTAANADAVVGWQNRMAPDQIVEGKNPPDTSGKWVPLFYAADRATATSASQQEDKA